MFFLTSGMSESRLCAMYLVLGLRGVLHHVSLDNALVGGQLAFTFKDSKTHGLGKTSCLMLKASR